MASRFIRAAAAVAMAILVGTSGVAVAGIASTAATAGTDGAQALERTQAGNETADGNATVTLQNQSSNGTAVTVASVTLPEGGFVEITDENGMPVGHTGYLDAGSYQEVTVTLDRSLSANQTVTAFVIRDANGNQQYDGTGPGNETDAPYTAATGEAAADEAFVRVTAGPEQAEAPRNETNVTVDNETNVTGNVTNETAVNETNVTEDNVTGANVTEGNVSEENVTEDNRTNVTGEPASLAFEDATSNRSAVVVQRATLPRGGFVVVHSEALLEGREAESVRGVSTYLPPGTHRNVTVRLDEPIPDSQRLVAVAYRDTDGDESFAFYEQNQTVDAPYFQDGNVAVADAAFVTVEAANATADGGNVTNATNASADRGNATTGGGNLTG